MENKKRRFLNMGYAIEVINGRLSGSAEEVERGGNAKNMTFVKKINGKGMVSTVCAKKNMQRFIEEVEGRELSKKVMELKKDGKKSRIMCDPHPAKYINDDIFGFMMAIKAEAIDEKEYKELDEDVKVLYKQKGNTKKYEKIGSGTMKRKSRLQMSPIVNVGEERVTVEWCVSKDENGNSLPINIETYAGVSYGIGNLDIDNVGKFNISDDEEFRDYSNAIASERKIKDLENDEKFKRIKSVLRSLEYLSIGGNQGNYLTDTKPKFIIFSEYSWGNNVFQGIMKADGIDIEMLKEIIERNEEFRGSDIWIGVDRFNSNKFESLREEIGEAFNEVDYVHVDNVHNTFKSYMEYLEKTLVKEA